MKHNPERERRWLRQRYHRLLDAGKCPRCGGDNPTAFKHCPACRAYYREACQKRIRHLLIEGRCVCCGQKKEASQINKRLCLECAKYNRYRARIHGR